LRKLLLLVAVVATGSIASTAQAITYGTPTGTAYGNVGGLVTNINSRGQTVDPFVYCTGTLISPTVFLTAAHCNISERTGNNTACVTFDPQLTSKSKLYCGTFTPSPYYTHRQNDPNDVAVVVFDQPVRGITPATVVQQVGYLDQLFASGGLNQSTQFVSVGYGGTEFTNAPGGPTLQYFDTRMYATGTFNSLGPGYIRISQNPATGNAGTCYGDSGGPQFLDGVQVSVTITGDILCKSTNVVQRLDTVQVQAFLLPYLEA
jgi:secreted trypsin-like serine protease